MDGDESDGAREPLLAAAAPSAPDPASADGGLGGFMPEHLEYPYLDEGLLQELRSIHEHDVEAGAPGPPEELPHDDDDVFKMRELIREKPEDVLHYIEEQGVLKVCEFEVQDSLAFKAFQNEGILTLGAEHFEMDWEDMWKERLADAGKAAASGWSTSVLLEAHVVNLRDAAAQGSKGLLQPLLKRYQAGGCSMAVFALPAVQAVIHYKWTSWARRFLLYELAAYCVWLLSFTAFTLLFQHEDWSLGFWQTIGHTYGLAATVSSLVSVAAMVPFMYMEACTLFAYSAVGWAASPWNILDMLSYVLQLAITALHLQREFVDEGWYSVMIAAQHVLMWTKLQYFARVFNPTKNTFVDTIRLVLEDLKWFLLFLLMTMVGFGMAFYALYRQDRTKFPDFANVWHAFASMFSYLLAMFDYNVFYNSTNPTAAMVLFLIYEFVLNVVMLNILVASMTNSFSKVTQDEGLRFLASKAEIIDELEATLPSWLKPRAWFPRFIHVLKFHPDSTYEVNLNSLWSGIGLMETNLLNAQEETRRRVEDMEERTSRVHRKLDVLIKMVIGLHPPQQLAAIHRQASRAAGASGGGAGRPRAGAGAPGARGFLHTQSAQWPAAAAAGGGEGGGGSGGGGGGPGRSGSAAGGLADQLERVSGPLLHGAAPHPPLPLPHAAAAHHWAALGGAGGPGGGPPGAPGGYYYPPFYPPAAAYGYNPYSMYGPGPYGPLGAAAGGGAAGSPGAYWSAGWPSGAARRKSGGGGGGGGALGLSPTASLSRRQSDALGAFAAAAAAAGGGSGSSQHLPSLSVATAPGGGGGGGGGERPDGGSPGMSPAADAAVGGQSPFAAAGRGPPGGRRGGGAPSLARRSGGRHPTPPPAAFWPHPYAVPIPIPVPRGGAAAHWPPGAPWPHGAGGVYGGPALGDRDVLPHSV